MSIEDLTKKVKEAAEKRTPEERAELLRKAHILDDNGEFCKEYFTSDYMEKCGNKGCAGWGNNFKQFCACEDVDVIHCNDFSPFRRTANEEPEGD